MAECICETCANYVYDEDTEEFICDISMDEDEYAHVCGQSDYRCPFFSFENEYHIVHKQI